MCSPSSPPPPDPIGTAQAQNAVNKDALLTSARLNQINQVNPFGSLAYSGSYDDPNNPRTQTVTLTPELQNILNGQTNITQGLTDLANSRLSQIPQNGFVAPNDPNTYADASWNTPLMRGDASWNTPLQQSAQTTGQGMIANVDALPLQYGFNSGGQVQRSINTDFAPQIQQAQDAAYNRASAYLDPQYAQEEQALRSRLSAQGITQGSDAYNTEIGNFERNKAGAYDQARNSAIQAGDSLQNQLFGQQLQGGQFSNQALAQQYAQNQGQAQFYNQTQGQNFGQGLSNAQLNNQVQNDIFGQNLANAQLNNQALGQNFNQGMQIVDQNNAALGQNFNQGMQLQNYNQTEYQRQLANLLQGRNQNFNELASFLNGSPISPNNPTFQPTSQYQAAQGSPSVVATANNNYSAAQQARAAVLGSIFGSVGSLGSAYLGGK